MIIIKSILIGILFLCISVVCVSLIHLRWDIATFFLVATVFDYLTIKDLQLIMGEIADDMIDGSSCSLCGCYFQHPDSNGPDEPKGYDHGYPVACKDCWEPNCGYPKATVHTF